MLNNNPALGQKPRHAERITAGEGFCSDLGFLPPAFMRSATQTAFIAGPLKGMLGAKN